MDDLESQVCRHLIKMTAGEIAAVIDVEQIVDAFDGPDRPVGLAPDGLAQGKAGLQGRGCTHENEVPCHGPGIIIHDGRQPWPCGLAVGIQDEDVQLRVIRLPPGVGFCGAVAKDQLILIPQRCGAVVSKRDQVRIEVADNGLDGAVGGCFNASGLGDAGEAAVKPGDRGSGLAERLASDQVHEVGRHLVCAGIGPDLAA